MQPSSIYQIQYIYIKCFWKHRYCLHAQATVSFLQHQSELWMVFWIWRWNGSIINPYSTIHPQSNINFYYQFNIEHTILKWLSLIWMKNAIYICACALHYIVYSLFQLKHNQNMFYAIGKTVLFYSVLIEGHCAVHDQRVLRLVYYYIGKHFLRIVLHLILSN